MLVWIVYSVLSCANRYAVVFVVVVVSADCCLWELISDLVVESSSRRVVKSSSRQIVKSSNRQIATSFLHSFLSCSDQVTALINDSIGAISRMNSLASLIKRPERVFID